MEAWGGGGRAREGGTFPNDPLPSCLTTWYWLMYLRPSSSLRIVTVAVSMSSSGRSAGPKLESLRLNIEVELIWKSFLCTRLSVKVSLLGLPSG